MSLMGLLSGEHCLLYIETNTNSYINTSWLYMPKVSLSFLDVYD